MKVVWITPKSDLIDTPSGVDSRVASVRYRALMPAAGLTARGHQAVVVGFDKVLGMGGEKAAMAFSDLKMINKGDGEIEFQLSASQAAQFESFKAASN